MTRQKVKKVLSSSVLSAKNFRPTIADINRWVEVLNHVMFEGKLPKFRKVIVRPMRGSYGWCVAKETRHKVKRRYCNLELCDKFESFAGFYTVLAHEMCHMAEWLELGTMNHGKFFYSHKEILKNIGVKLQTHH